MRIRTIIGMLVVGLCHAGIALGADENYSCVVLNGYGIDARGALKGGPTPEGLRFEVDRETGRIVGDYIANRRADPNVVHAGDDRMPFRLVSLYEGPRFETLVIRENAEGSRKPFYAIYAYGIITGLCD